MDDDNGKIISRRTFIRDDDSSPSIKTRCALDIKGKQPKWIRNLWRGTTFTQKIIEKTIAALEDNDVCLAGDGSVRDQLGAHAWCIAKSTSEKPFFSTSGPVDGNRHTMRALRAEATHALAGIVFIRSLEKYVKREDVTIHYYTDCKTLVNRVHAKNVNNPTLVLADHMDLIYQLRQLIEDSKFTIKLSFAKSIKNDEFDLGTHDEKLVQRMHLIAYGYFTKKTAIIPKTYMYASLSHHGLASQDYFVNQGVDHIVKMLAHIAKHTYVGGLLEAILELAALEIGSGTNIFRLDYELWSPD